MKVDDSQQNHATAVRNKGCGIFVSNAPLVPDGPKWASEWHDFDSFLPSALNGIGTKECRLYRNKIFSQHPYLANALANRYIQIAKQRDYTEANLFIGRIDKELQLNDLNLSSPTDEIKDFCENIAHKCRLTVVEYGENKISYDICQQIAKKYKIEIQNFDEKKIFIPTLNKLSCFSWWFKKINTLRIRHIEQVQRKLGVVNKNKNCYASNFASEFRNTQLKNSFEYLSSNEIINTDGQTYSLLDIYNKSVSNPAIRKAELMTRIRGFEEVAQHMGHVGEFYTLTAPSKYHAYSNGKLNPKFNGFTPKQVHKYFNDYWKLIRSAFQKKNILPYGFRVVEPHHDGTPHWHLMLFMHPADIKTSRKIFKKYALQEDSNERGAKEHRFKAISIDPNKGSAAGYIAKYISKNIDGSDLDTDLYGNDAKPASSKIDAWSSVWGIRQFQQIGGPSVTVWRELRRLKEPGQPEIEQAFNAADSGDWAAFVLAMGGAMLPRRNRPIHPFYEKKPTESIDSNTGEVIQSNSTRYGEEKLPSIVGLICKGLIKKTRVRIWRKLEPMMAFSPKTEGRMTELAKKMRGRDPRKREGPKHFSWTCVNNCTN